MTVKVELPDTSNKPSKPHSSRGLSPWETLRARIQEFEKLEKKSKDALFSLQNDYSCDAKERNDILLYEKETLKDLISDMMHEDLVGCSLLVRTLPGVVVDNAGVPDIFGKFGTIKHYEQFTNYIKVEYYPGLPACDPVNPAVFKVIKSTLPPPVSNPPAPSPP